jgi:hypothetical protein
MRRAGFEPARSRTSFSRLLPIGLPPRHAACAHSGRGGSRTLNSLVLNQAPLPVGLPGPWRAHWPGWDLNPHVRRSERRASCRLGYLAIQSPCGGWDSNPHCRAPKTRASCLWATAAERAAYQNKKPRRSLLTTGASPNIDFECARPRWSPCPPGNTANHEGRPQNAASLCTLRTLEV